MYHIDVTASWMMVAWQGEQGLRRKEMSRHPQAQMCKWFIRASESSSMQHVANKCFQFCAEFYAPFLPTPYLFRVPCEPPRNSRMTSIAPSTVVMRNTRVCAEPGARLLKNTAGRTTSSAEIWPKSNWCVDMQRGTMRFFYNFFSHIYYNYTV